MDPWLDKNLQLALLDATFARSGRSFDELEAAYNERRKGKRAPSWKSIAEQFEPRHNKLLEVLLLEQPLDPRVLGAIERLTLDGDRDIYPLLFPDWWHFGSHFTIRDLRDLVRCPALSYLHLGQGLVADCSLACLEDLPVLRELSLCATGGYKDVEAVADLPSLRQIEVVNLAHDKTGVWKATIEKLVARGVKLKTW